MLPGLQRFSLDLEACLCVIIPYMHNGQSQYQQLQIYTFIISSEQRMCFETSILHELEGLSKETVVHKRRTDRQFAWMD